MKPQRNSRPREMMEIFLFCGTLLGCANIWCSLLWMISFYNHGKDASDHWETVCSSGPQPFWHHEAVSWKTIFPWTRVGGMVSEGFKHVTLTVQFISVLLYQLHPRSWDIKSWRWRTPGLWKDFSLLYECPATFMSHAPGFNSLVDGGTVNFFGNCGA